MSHGHYAPIQQTGSYRAWDIACAGGVGDMVWHCRVDHGRPEAHRLLPFSEPSIVVRRTFDEEDHTLDCALLICPAQPDGGIYSPAPGEEQFAIRLAPELMESALGMRAAEFAHGERPVPITQCWAFDAARFAAEAGDKREVLQSLLSGVARNAGAPNRDHIAAAANILRRTSGRPGPAQLAEMVDISPRHLRREFGRRFGMSPRAMARRLRLTRAMMEAEQSAHPNWAGIAAGCGFSDQSHLVRECRVILRERPLGIHAQRLAMAVSFNT